MKTLPEALRALPALDPPAGAWPRLAAALDAAPRPARRIRRAGWAGLGLAAGLLLALLLPGTPTAPGEAPTDELTQLMRESAQLEQALTLARRETVLWDSRRARRSAELAQGLQLLDLQLSYAAGENPRQARQLWRNRVNLMSQLVAEHQPQTDPATLDTPATEYTL